MEGETLDEENLSQFVEDNLDEDLQQDIENGDDEDDIDEDDDADDASEAKSIMQEERSKAGTPSSCIDQLMVPSEGEFPPSTGETPSLKRGVKGARAKAVDCYNLDGSLLATYPSGLIASRALGISQGDVSLCCRGLKDSVAIYRFRFQGDTTDYTVSKTKRGYQIVDDELNGESVLTALGERRLKRSLRNQSDQHELNGVGLVGNAEHKVRQWDMLTVNLGPFSIKQWVPKTQELNLALQEHRRSMINQQKKSKGFKASKVVRRGRGG